jgi:hypothetical protein
MQEERGAADREGRVGMEVVGRVYRVRLYGGVLNKEVGGWDYWSDKLT